MEILIAALTVTNHTRLVQIHFYAQATPRILRVYMVGPHVYDPPLIYTTLLACFPSWIRVRTCSESGIV